MVMKFQVNAHVEAWQFDNKYYFKYWAYGPTLQVFPSEKSFKMTMNAPTTRPAADNDMRHFIKIIFEVKQIVDQSWI
jgi:hypothetical protein